MERCELAARRSSDIFLCRKSLLCSRCCSTLPLAMQPLAMHVFATLNLPEAMPTWEMENESCQCGQATHLSALYPAACQCYARWPLLVSVALVALAE